jgi:hypothetical protein
VEDALCQGVGASDGEVGNFVLFGVGRHVLSSQSSSPRPVFLLQARHIGINSDQTMGGCKDAAKSSMITLTAKDSSAF